MKPFDNENEATSAQNEYVGSRIGELKRNLLKLLEGLIKFLFAANSGGVIAVATFIKIDGVSFGLYPKIAITCYILGILSASTLLIHTFIRAYNVDKAWHSDVNKWESGELSYGGLNLNDDARTHSDTFEFILMFFGFAAFSIGTVILTLAVWCT